MSRSCGFRDIAAIVLFGWMLGVIEVYDAGPSVHFLLAASVALVVAELRT